MTESWIRTRSFMVRYYKSGPNKGRPVPDSVLAQLRLGPDAMRLKHEKLTKSEYLLLKKDHRLKGGFWKKIKCSHRGCLNFIQRHSDIRVFTCTEHKRERKRMAATEWAKRSRIRETVKDTITQMIVDGTLQEVVAQVLYENRALLLHNKDRESQVDHRRFETREDSESNEHI